MPSAESIKSGGPEEDPSLPLQDISFTLTERRELLSELASVFHNQRAVERILRSTTFPPGRIPAFENSTAEEVWGEILLELDHGAVRAGNYQLLTAVARPYPDNPVFRQLIDRHLGGAQPAARGGASAPAHDGRRDEPAEQPPAEAAAESAPPRMCHVIVRASTEEAREQSARVLQALGLQPEEQWSTAHAVSYRVATGRTEEVRALLDRQTEFGWTVVAPGLRDYLLHTLYLEGPDGRQFRITDAPAQQTVGNLAAEVVDQYHPALPDAARPAVVDKVGKDGQGRRLDPKKTLDESRIVDGDRMRVGFLARAAAVNPLDHQDALYRVRNQILAFADSRDEAIAFVVRANSTVLPTEYELEFIQPSFGPPPAPDAPPTDIDQHAVLIQLDSDFPVSPPTVFWLTPIFHPNVFPTYECDVSRGREIQMGLVCLGALQEEYVPSLDFGSLCQLLIDIAAYRNYSLYKDVGSVDVTGVFRRKVDYFDPDAADWVQSEEGQRRIAAIKGTPIEDPPAPRRPYHNVIERIGGA
jgi:ubiquitin-protein ligase